MIWFLHAFNLISSEDEQRFFFSTAVKSQIDGSQLLHVYMIGLCNHGVYSIFDFLFHKMHLTCYNVVNTINLILFWRWADIFSSSRQQCSVADWYVAVNTSITSDLYMIGLCNHGVFRTAFDWLFHRFIHLTFTTL